MAAQDPFYLVRDEIQDSVNKVQEGFARFERLSVSDPERERISKSLAEECTSVEWQLDELDKAIGVAARDPARFNIDRQEIESRRNWTDSTKYQMAMVRRALQDAAQARSAMQREMARRELLRVSPDTTTSSGGGGAATASGENLSHGGHAHRGSDDDRQALIIKEQDEQLDAMSQSLARLGGMGMAIHEELGAQDSIINELNEGVDNTSGRLELVQKKLMVVMKKAGFKGQLLMLAGLLVLFFILIALLVYS